MTNYDDDDEYYSIRSDTHKQRALKERYNLPSVDEMKDTLVNACREGIVTIINTWIKRCKAPITLEMLIRLKESVSNKTDLQNRSYDFHIHTMQIGDDFERILYFGRDGKTPSEIKEETPQKKVEIVTETKVYKSNPVVPGVKWSSIVKKVEK